MSAALCSCPWGPALREAQARLAALSPEEKAARRERQERNETTAARALLRHLGETGTFVTYSEALGARLEPFARRLLREGSHVERLGAARLLVTRKGAA